MNRWYQDGRVATTSKYIPTYVSNSPYITFLPTYLSTFHRGYIEAGLDKKDVSFEVDDKVMA